MPVQQKFKDYLEGPRLDSCFEFFADGNVSVHWTNCLEMREHFQERYKTGDEYLVTSLEKELSDLKSEVVWLRNRRGILKLTMFDLYQAYSDPLLSPMLFKQQGEEQFCYSTGTEAGPFLCLAGLSWMNPRLYRQFVYAKILRGHLGIRDFRLSVNLDLDFTLEGRPLDTYRMHLSQVTSRGLLFELPIGFRLMSDKGIIDEVVNFYLPTGLNLNLNSSDFKSLSENLKLHSNKVQEQSYLQAHIHYNCSEQLQRHYLYIKYDDFSGEQAGRFQDFFIALLASAREETQELMSAAA